ncbi:hypothetical protein L2E82_40415 [Cichorium intybus]|uniref:Uncharacterized protein n=1 Tax=Cichorium intybus TaxID=13427 RepID=A0ACB9AKE3_CICIN|nr:hypothetical protein L2E82_40415 [Cichorium intybus]
MQTQGRGMTEEAPNKLGAQHNSPKGLHITRQSREQLPKVDPALNKPRIKSFASICAIILCNYSESWPPVTFSLSHSFPFSHTNTVDEFPWPMSSESPFTGSWVSSCFRNTSFGSERDSSETDD